MAVIAASSRPLFFAGITAARDTPLRCAAASIPVQLTAYAGSKHTRPSHGVRLLWRMCASGGGQGLWRMTSLSV
jgi:hypothetical protein